MLVKMLDKEFEVSATPADFWSWVDEGRYNSEWLILAKHLRAEHTFVDVGAWIGSHSLFASSVAKEVRAIEPDPVAFAILQANILPIPNIQAQQIAISGHKGTTFLGSSVLGASTTRSNRHEGAGIGPWVEGQQFEIGCVTLREFCADLPDPLFVKLDCEGGEEEIFRDAAFFEERHPTVYVECHPFWWRDEEHTWADLRRIAGYYRSVLDLQMRPIDLSSMRPRAVILTDTP